MNESEMQKYALYNCLSADDVTCCYCESSIAAWSERM